MSGCGPPRPRSKLPTSSSTARMPMSQTWRMMIRAPARARKAKAAVRKQRICRAAKPKARVRVVTPRVRSVVSDRESLSKCTDACVHRAPRCIPAAWHRIAPCTTVHHHLCAPAPWCITVVVHRIAPCTTVRDRPCAPALRCISATLHHVRCTVQHHVMCDPGVLKFVGAYFAVLVRLQ